MNIHVTCYIFCHLKFRMISKLFSVKVLMPKEQNIVLYGAFFKQLWRLLHMCTGELTCVQESSHVYRRAHMCTWELTCVRKSFLFTGSISVEATCQGFEKYYKPKLLGGEHSLWKVVRVCAAPRPPFSDHSKLETTISSPSLAPETPLIFFWKYLHFLAQFSLILAKFQLPRPKF